MLVVWSEVGRLFFVFVCFFFNDTATTEIYPLALHDALPIWKQSPRRAQRKANPVGTRRSQTQGRSTPGESGTMGGQERGSESRRGKAASEVEGEERMESGPVETTVSKERDGYQERECEIEESSLLGRFRLRVNRREKIRRGGARTRGSSQSLRSKGKNPSEDSVEDSLSQSRSQRERFIPRHTFGVRAKPQAGHMQPATTRAAALTRGKGRRGKQVRIENWYQSSPSSSSNEGGCVDDRNSEDPEGKEDFKQRSRRKRAWRYSEEESENEVDKAQTTLLSDSPDTPVLVHHMTRRRKAQRLQLSPSSNSRVTAPSKSSLFYFGPNPSKTFTKHFMQKQVFQINLVIIFLFFYVCEFHLVVPCLPVLQAASSLSTRWEACLGRAVVGLCMQQSAKPMVDRLARH